MGLAGVHDAPVLYTDGADVPTVTAQALQSLLGTASGSKTVYLVGGAQGAAATVAAYGYQTVTVAGSDRFQTAVSAYNNGVGNWGDTAKVTYGFNYPDAMSISSFAYGDKAPVFFTEESTCMLQSSEVSAIASGGFSHVILLGGTSVVANGVSTQLSQAGYTGSVTRFSRSSRYATNAAIARWLVGSCDYSYNGMALATGENFPDAFAGGCVCGEEGSVLVIAPDDESSNDLAVLDGLVGNDACDANVLNMHFLGSTGALPPFVRTRVLSLLGWI